MQCPDPLSKSEVWPAGGQCFSNLETLACPSPVLAVDWPSAPLSLGFLSWKTEVASAAQGDCEGCAG